MVGELAEPVAVDEFLRGVKATLGLPTVRTSAHDGTKPVRRVAICGGAGAEFIGDALAAKADVYLTADLKYHDFQRPEGRMVLADIGHYESEQFAKEIIFRAISEKFSTFACRISDSQMGMVSYI
jgi:putative NIF3 family GTP cyclohydrolase 1 type 2